MMVCNDSPVMTTEDFAVVVYVSMYSLPHGQHYSLVYHVHL